MGKGLLESEHKITFFTNWRRKNPDFVLIYPSLGFHWQQMKEKQVEYKTPYANMKQKQT